MNKKALIAMSGGVDSSVAAYLTGTYGYKCEGAIMRLFEKNGSETDDADDAARICDKLCIPFRILDMREEFRHTVIDSFIHSYENGETPNPCIECNKKFKFGRFLEYAMKLGMDCIVTGHYAQIEKSGDRYILKKGADESKDQSYVLYHLTQHQLSRTVFPLGAMTKTQIRTIAEEKGFVNAHKKDSQDICFVPDGDYISVIKEYSGKQYPCGNFVNTGGEVIGSHLGIINYTIGQRKGLGCAFGERLYVVDKNVSSNTVVLGKNEELFSKTINAKDANWIVSDNMPETFRAHAKIRYNSKEAAAVICRTGENTFSVEFDDFQRAPAKGQSVVIYDGDTVVGGGIIC
ncbi:MAG: tRNA 2-thiouridine(34) synthase MnmA [Clostridia bacterium]|nr:tRNA 2-thiouridine(34) synthase MnmA [Clostridia bacterium]